MRLEEKLHNTVFLWSGDFGLSHLPVFTFEHMKTPIRSLQNFGTVIDVQLRI